MQVSSTLLIVAAEVCAALLIGGVILFIYTRKLKSLVKRQQSKLVTLINDLKISEREREKATAAPPPPPAAPVRLYKDYIVEMIDKTTSQYSSIAPDSDIEAIQGENSSELQRILALRYAYLQAEKLSTQEIPGSETYWNTFQQTLEPLLSANKTTAEVDAEELESKMDAYKKRAESAAAVTVEKELIIYELDQQVKTQSVSMEELDTTVQLLKGELGKLQDEIAEKEKILEEQALIHQENESLKDSVNKLSTENEEMTTKVDLLEAENATLKQEQAENNERTQKELDDAAATIAEKELAVSELQQQLQNQTRATQASEACIQVLSDELLKTQQKVSQKEQALEEQVSLSEENQQLKESLQKLAAENKELASKLSSFEAENIALKEISKKQSLKPTEPVAATSDGEKDVLIQDLEQQLQQQTRATKESETSVKILSDELLKVKDEHLKVKDELLKVKDEHLKVKTETAEKEKSLNDQTALTTENQRLKGTLHKLDMASKELALKFQALEAENNALKQTIEENSKQEATSSSAIDMRQYKKMEAKLKDLEEEYEQLEEKYLALQMGDL